MHHPVRRKVFMIILALTITKTNQTDTQTDKTTEINNSIESENEYYVKFNDNYDKPWKNGEFDKVHRYTLVQDKLNESEQYDVTEETDLENTTSYEDLNDEVTTTNNTLDADTTENTEETSVDDGDDDLEKIILNSTDTIKDVQNRSIPNVYEALNTKSANKTADFNPKNETEHSTEETENLNSTINSNSTNMNDNPVISNTNDDNATDIEDIPIFTELDVDSSAEDVPEDYYDAKDVMPTKAPNTDALSVLVGLAGGLVESVAERVVPKGILDLFKRYQKQQQQVEAERLRSREENGGLGQFGRGLLKQISSSLTKPLSQLMSTKDPTAKEGGSLDTDKGFVSSIASGVSSVANVANSLLDNFKNHVQAIYPGTVWCGDGHSAQARVHDLGLFFFTDTCCRQHDACKMYILAGETKFGLTNTGLFTRSHCSCDIRFRECLRKTSSLVSTQIGLTYFNVLGPQCFRRAHPIVKCLRRTRITGQKCEEYELDYSKPKMWQWFDNETF